MRLAGVISASCEAFLPCLCLHCGEPVGGDQIGLCGACWPTVVPRAGVVCPRCAGPCDGALVECLTCQASAPAQLGTVAWGEYDGALRSAVLGLKTRGRDELSEPLGRRLAARIAVEDWSFDLELVVHVPSHPLRLVRRGWPAAASLARVVGRELGLPARPLLKRRGLQRQTGRSRAERTALPRRSFRAAGAVAGRCVLIVDDVTTTGTTLSRAAEVLLAAGADAVYCAAMAVTPDSRRAT
ncbi:MAG TPA: phosphoribosyltransferase family protein [Thermoanaerobaculales bacterium]|nr:phosphoribosyltransferase family protein [Thermoanaerobaculales bacterium]HPA82807.1 phosphoribosyltransferase family protein [Thermoanaerobaculales bacterium]HQL28793.1 phosphoribosyltransferase family protein [Thermoanaerobaculales bacterium]HQN96097.1 phosphoribosyltransferase family protein [Thermoanaerobaculales bacterium]HQP43079.1 phosphoribosyltransferase family protein [Thermoanaerobaculales bacterium]